MAHRQFTDDAGADWIAYDVVPRADERRNENRRDGDRPAPEADERGGEDRRLTVGGVRPVRLTQGWVCFEREGERRRLQPIPANWNTLPDNELVQLLAQARAAPHRTATADRAGNAAGAKTKNGA